MKIDVNNIKVKIGKKIILKNISFATEKNLAIVGPSGSGKTTLLRCVAGLQDYQGSILFNDKKIDNTPTKNRNIGMVTQDLALFPHLSVFENIAFPLKIRKNNKQTISEKVNNILIRFRIKDLAERLPQEISGGEQQRTALARAIIYKPDLLLLDEPFAQLDAELRNDLLHWLKDVLNKEKILTLFVTHNIEEAEFIGENIFRLC
ncbi:MAG: ATP-binding cassette domain-containing protein [Patescibacteria group bacterium]|nr:ATP-binding cassette domain-containing protein [Patescibacteria group bacterium]